MSLTIIALELFSLVALMSMLMFYAGVNYRKFKTSNSSFDLFLPESSYYFGKTGRSKKSINIIEIKDAIQRENPETKTTNANTSTSQKKITKVPVTPRMTIYKTIDED
jgi:hypothetical protein